MGMEWFVRGFIRAAVTWLGVGVALGLLMAFWPAGYVVRPAHLHANLLGFVSMMIFGVAYHVLPRFAGRQLHRRRWAGVHFWLANVGLTLQVSGFLARPFDYRVGSTVLGVGAIATAAGVALFIVNVWRTLEPVPVTVGPSSIRPPRPAPTST